MSTVQASLRVNGADHEIVVEDRTTLADALRGSLRLTGTHLGCEHGVCGSCTVLLDGEPVRSCLMFAVQADGYEVTTIEGVASQTPELVEAFTDSHSFQCGFCTPGFMVTTCALVARSRKRAFTDSELREELSGNLCRCTGYTAIIDAVRHAMFAGVPVAIDE